MIDEPRCFVSHLLPLIGPICPLTIEFTVVLSPMIVTSQRWVLRYPGEPAAVHA